jgi:DegV family protein with EDD domain
MTSKRRVAVVTGSISSLTSELAERFHIAIVPYYLVIDGHTQREDPSFDRTAFYKKLRAMKGIPTTSHPNLQDIIDILRNVSKDADSVFYLTVPSGITGTQDRIHRVMEELPDLRLEFYDGGVGIGRLALMAIEAARAANEGKTLEQVRAHVEESNRRSGFFGVLNTLEYLARGGRIGRARALLGQVLSVKPVLTYENGQVIPATKAMTHRQALEWIVRRIRRHMRKTKTRALTAFVEDADDRPWSVQVRKRLEEEFDCKEIYQATLSPVAGTHLGPGAWAVSYLLEK